MLVRMKGRARASARARNHEISQGETVEWYSGLCGKRRARSDSPLQK